MMPAVQEDAKSTELEHVGASSFRRFYVTDEDSESSRFGGEERVAASVDTWKRVPHPPMLFADPAQSITHCSQRNLMQISHVPELHLLEL